MRKPNTLYRFYRSQTCYVATWEENGRYRKMRFFDYSKKRCNLAFTEQIQCFRTTRILLKENTTP